MKKIEIFKVENDKITRQRRVCPKCGDGVFLAEHKNRISCGKCGYTEFKGSGKKPQKVEPETVEKEGKQ
ncbi:MAG: 30S ribosomal protein S27ae [Candidatus Thermoplasmatota archaeon]|nr:30S ribosomal protein S27ae [Candidatus Thermoplasmatota archaeon]